MGVLGDGIVQGDATELLMRTPPLWGVRTRTQLLHDGRAGLEMGEDTLPGRVHRAIIEHDGEASAARDAYLLLSRKEQNSLFAFMDSLGRAEFDYNGDEKIDEADFTVFASCFTGPGDFYTPDDFCSIGDVEQDGDVDLDDFNLFLTVYEGMDGLGDCNSNMTLDLLDIISGTSEDCNDNATPDECDIASGDSPDSNSNGIPDECENQFVRGDDNGDGLLNVADPVFNLTYLFSDGPSFCLAAQDTNDEGQVNIADPIYHLTYQFSMGAPPPAPFPDCGLDPTADLLGCEDFTCP